MKVYRLAFLAFLIPWNCFDSFAWSGSVDSPTVAQLAPQ